MHPALIPEKHPMCGKYMEALVKCRQENPYRRYFGECNDITYQLTNCLALEKKVLRAPRQQKYQEKWKKKREEDLERMRQLEEAATARKLAQEAASSSTDQQAPVTQPAAQ